MAIQDGNITPEGGNQNAPVDHSQNAQQLVTQIEHQRSQAAAGSGEASGSGANENHGGDGKPVVYAGIAQDAFSKALVEATGGKVGNLDALNQLVGTQGQYSALQEKYSQLEAQSKVNPFADPLSETINKMLANGSSHAEVANFVNLQSRDFSKLGDREILFEKYKHDNPFLSTEDINRLIDSEFAGMEADPNDPESKPDLTVAAKFRQAAGQARNFMDDLKVKNSKPESIRAQEAQQADRAVRSKAWGQVMSAQMGPEPTYKIAFKDEKSGLDINLDYKLQPNQIQQINQQVMQFLVGSDIPITENGLQMANQFMRRATMFIAGDSIVETIIRHVAGNVSQKDLAKFAGLNGLQNNQQQLNLQQQQQQVPQGNLTMEQIRQARMNGG